MNGCAICNQTDALVPYFPMKSRAHAALPWVMKCTRCQLVLAHPQPSDEELASIYDDNYYEQFGFAGSRASTGLVSTKEATFWSLLEHAEPALPAGLVAPRLLDVGCGLGFSLLAASARGFVATGLDPLAPANPATLPGRVIRRGTLEDTTLDEPFDIITMVDAIEHVRDPARTIQGARANLTKNGILVLATNDVESLGQRIMGHRWTHFHRAHLWFFSPKTLHDVVRDNGFEVLSTRHFQRTYNLDYIASILARGSNFPVARTASEAVLRTCPKGLRNQPWPPITEGFALVARVRL